MKHFKLTSETKVNFLGKTLFRIELITDCKWGKIGDKGGFLEKEENLSGNAWVFGNAEVFGNARVFGDAEMTGNARVSGDAWVFGNAEVFGNARVSGNAEVYGNARVFGNAEVSGDARVSGDAWVFGDAEVYGNAEVTKKVFILNFCYNLTLTDNHIKFGCEMKTVKEWEDWLKSGQIINTPRSDKKFKLIEMSLNLAIEQWKQLNS